MQGIAECLFLILSHVFDIIPLISKYSQSSHTSNGFEGNINVFILFPAKYLYKNFQHIYLTKHKQFARITITSFKISNLNKTFACMLIFHCKSKQGIAH